MSEFAILSAVLMLVLTLFVALAERKFLAAAQRRMGPTLMGRNGAFQILADLIKLVTKEVYLVPRPATTGAPIFLTLLFTSQILFSLNFV
jgi:NADH-quinone oxidoreductase subunit H